MLKDFELNVLLLFCHWYLLHRLDKVVQRACRKRHWQFLQALNEYHDEFQNQSRIEKTIYHNALCCFDIRFHQAQLNLHQALKRF